MILIHASFIPKRKKKLKKKWKMRGYPSFEMSFFQKSDVIWSLGHHPCSEQGLVY